MIPLHKNSCPRLGQRQCINRLGVESREEGEEKEESTNCDEVTLYMWLVMDKNSCLWIIRRVDVELHCGVWSLKGKVCKKI